MFLKFAFSEASSIALFELSGCLFLAVSSLHHPFVSGFSQVFAKKDDKWQLTQRIPTSGSFVKHFKYENYHYLAFANSAPMYEIKEPKSIKVRFSIKSRIFLICISSSMLVTDENF